ncbi:MAG: hypothetical protein KDA28_09970, partial [Phycisphaerales bacterium]|nr:hypothetical protein [Phycisphaerales bacterium]
ENALTVSYSAGSYRVNFVKAVFILWLKLAFLAMVGVCASTFLSFPVAAMVAFGIFFCAESASFLTATLEYYGTTNTDGDIVPHKFITYYISMAVGWVFAIYAELRPTTYLVDGRLLTFGAVAQGTTVLGVLIGLLYAIGTAVFRRRELAMYSGH